MALRVRPERFEDALDNSREVQCAYGERSVRVDVDKVEIDLDVPLPTTASYNSHPLDWPKILFIDVFYHRCSDWHPGHTTKALPLSRGVRTGDQTNASPTQLQ